MNKAQVTAVLYDLVALAALGAACVAVLKGVNGSLRISQTHGSTE